MAWAIGVGEGIHDRRVGARLRSWRYGDFRLGGAEGAGCGFYLWFGDGRRDGLGCSIGQVADGVGAVG